MVHAFCKAIHERKGMFRSTGSIGVYFNINDPKNVSKNLDSLTILKNETINTKTVELASVYECLSSVLTNHSMEEDPYTLHIYTDSKYAIRALVHGLPRWEKTQYKYAFGCYVRNYALIRSINQLLSSCELAGIHVNFHYYKSLDRAQLSSSQSDSDIWEKCLWALRLAENAH